MKCAYVTLLTSDSYLAGALVTLYSVKQTFSTFPFLILVTPETVSPETVNLVSLLFDKVVFVPPFLSQQHEELKLLGRPELDVTFTKLHVWNPCLLPFDKIIFLDADVLVLQSIDCLFDYLKEEIVFAAAPDIGWPDCFNSGVFATCPSHLLYTRLVDHMKEVGSFDGMFFLFFYRFNSFFIIQLYKNS
jgi:alpha-N-acetylglucosamine transferase